MTVTGYVYMDELLGERITLSNMIPTATKRKVTFKLPEGFELVQSPGTSSGVQRYILHGDKVCNVEYRDNVLCITSAGKVLVQI